MLFRSRHATGTADFETKLAGAETTIEIEEGCPSGVAIELWTMTGAGHLPAFNAAFAPALWAWFSAHHR